MLALKFVFILSGLLLLSSCSKQSPTGAVSVMVIQPTSGHCKYSISPARLETLVSLKEMRGTVGRVLYSRDNLGSKPEILNTGEGLKPLDTEFIQSGSTFGPVDYTSLFAASLYYALETSYLNIKRVDPMIDLVTLIPNLADTRIIYEARRNFGKPGAKPEVHDNAEYLPHVVRNGATQQTLNYFFSYPTDKVKEIPLGLNLGIMTHEYSHLVFQHLFYEKGDRRGMTLSKAKPTENTLAALDEGMADYFGYLTAKDPAYFLCTFPYENRNLAVPKSFTPEVVQRLASSSGDSFDPHEGGAVWASIQYEIGNVMGSHDANAKALLALMSNILDCPSTSAGSNTLSFNFGDIARCHETLLGGDSRASQVHTIYQKYLGTSYGGNP